MIIFYGYYIYDDLLWVHSYFSIDNYNILMSLSGVLRVHCTIIFTSLYSDGFNCDYIILIKLCTVQNYNYTP